MNGLRDGDVYRWSWLNPPEHMPYWCKAQRAIAKDGNLFDLFHIHHGSKFIQGGWGPGLHSDCCIPVDKVQFKLIGNIHDMDEIRHGDEQFYDPEDVLDLRHSNNGNAPVYIKRGAVRNAEKITERIRQKIADAESDLRFTERTIQRLKETLQNVETGCDLNSIWF